MANHKFRMGRKEAWLDGVSTIIEAAYYICDTDAGKPVTGLNVGDLCWAVNTGILYCATSTTTWAAINVAGQSTLRINGTLASPPRLEYRQTDSAYGPLAHMYLQPPTLSADERILFLPDDDGYLISQPTTTTFRGRATVLGVSADPAPSNEMATVNQPGKTAAMASTIMVNSGNVGLYRISYFLRCTTADVTAGTISASFTFTDNVGSTTDTSAVVALTSTVNRTQGSFLQYKASGNITYLTTLTGIAGSSQYQLRARCEFLGNTTVL